MEITSAHCSTVMASVVKVTLLVPWRHTRLSELSCSGTSKHQDMLLIFSCYDEGLSTPTAKSTACTQPLGSASFKYCLDHTILAQVNFSLKKILHSSPPWPLCPKTAPKDLWCLCLHSPVFPPPPALLPNSTHTLKPREEVMWSSLLTHGDIEPQKTIVRHGGTWVCFQCMGENKKCVCRMLRTVPVMKQALDKWEMSIIQSRCFQEPTRHLRHSPRPARLCLFIHQLKIFGFALSWTFSTKRPSVIWPY